MKDCFIFSHGWGLTAQFWENLKPYFTDCNCVFLDHGYFGEMLLSPLLGGGAREANFIGIGHSLGLIKLLKLNIKFKALVSLQGFINFLGSQPNLREQRQLELQALKEHFSTNPEKTLRSLHKKCGIDQEDLFDFTNINLEKLTQDFPFFEQIFVLPPDIPLLVLAAKNDRVVSPELINDNFLEQKQVKMVLQAKGRHGLGYQESHFIYEQIRGFLDELTKR